MIGFSHQVDVPQPPHHVFEMLADMDDLDKWNPSVTSSRRTQGNFLEINSKYESTLTRGPISMTARSTLIAVEPGRNCSVRGSNGPVLVRRYADVQTIAPRDPADIPQSDWDPNLDETAPPPDQTPFSRGRLAGR